MEKGVCMEKSMHMKNKRQRVLKRQRFLKWQRFLAAGLMISMLLSCASCKKKKDAEPEETYPHVLNEASYMEWWDDTEVEVSPVFPETVDESAGGTAQANVMPPVGDKVFVTYTGYYRMDDQASATGPFVFLTCYSIGSSNAGQHLGDVDISACINTDEIFARSVEAVREVDGKLRALVKAQYIGQAQEVLYDCELDLSSGKALAPRPIDFESAVGEHVSISQIKVASGKYYILGYLQSGASAGAPVFLVSDGETCQRLHTDVIEAASEFGVYDDKNLIIVGASADKKTCWLLNTEEDVLGGMVDVPEDYILGGDLLDGLGFAKVGNQRMTCWSFAEEKEKKYIDFNYTGISYEDAIMMQLISATDEQVVVYDNAYDQAQWVLNLHILKKSQNNPHIGKRVIKCAFLRAVTPVQSEAIQAFNRESLEYYAIIINDYSYFNFIDWDAENHNLEVNRAKSEAVNKLMADILSGKGPDVLLDGAEYLEIQNYKYLVNLKKNIDELDLSKKEYFTHVIDTCEINGRISFLPLEFRISGYFIDREKAGKRTGVKMSEYSDFLAEYYNGYDPLYTWEDQLSYLDYVIENCYDLFIGKDGKYNFDNSAFREVTEYICRNVPEQFSEVKGAGEIAALSGINSGDNSLVLIRNKKLVGLPSPDGRGPRLVPETAAAITACSSCQEGDWELIKFMLKDDIQAEALYIPLCRSVVDTWNMSDDVKDYFIDTIDDCGNYATSDYTVIGIINEEMPAYFLGQKSLDDVISIINNRVSVIQNERG
ncbi:MAG: carbohydrate ABC transporter substrate-binding protein [Clostridiales bacterium]|nr:carbohydrate ABC transporter substrate-binding protein [Clostridiales bacterium]